MHADIRPFLPLTESNPLYRLFDIETLHGLCVAAGALGALWLAVRLALRCSAESRP